MIYLLIFTIVIVAAILKGATGFGFSLIALPILAFFVPVKMLIPALTFGNLFASVMIAVQAKPRAKISTNALILIVSGTVATLFGVVFLRALKDNTLIHTLAITIIAISAISLAGKGLKLTESRFKHTMAGIFSGLLAGGFSIAGPPLALYLNAINTPGTQFRDIFAWFSIATATIALAGYGFSGFITHDAITLSALLIPSLIAGTMVGQKLHMRIPQKLFANIILVICIVSGFVLLAKHV